MKVTYSPTADAMYIKMNDGLPVSIKRITEGVIADIDADGKLIGIELLDASTFIDDPRSVSHETLNIASEKPDPELIKARRKAIAEARLKAKHKTKES
jgi:uncharacterized protein YuzE